MSTCCSESGADPGALGSRGRLGSQVTRPGTEQSGSRRQCTVPPAGSAGRAQTDLLSTHFLHAFPCQALVWALRMQRRTDRALLTSRHEQGPEGVTVQAPRQLGLPASRGPSRSAGWSRGVCAEPQQASHRESSGGARSGLSRPQGGWATAPGRPCRAHLSWVVLCSAPALSPAPPGSCATLVLKGEPCRKTVWVAARGSGDKPS